MKWKKGLTIGIITGVLSFGAVASVIAILKKKNSEAYDSYDDTQDDYYVQDDSNLDYGFYEFNSIKDMYKAKGSNQFNVDAFYEVEGKGYLVLCLDGTEDGICKYGGRELNNKEINDFLKKTIVDTMYFYFENEDFLYDFHETIRGYIPDNKKIQIINYYGGYYINLSEINPKKHNNVRCIASEFLGKEVKDMYIANCLKKYFELAKDN